MLEFFETIKESKRALKSSADFLGIEIKEENTGTVKSLNFELFIYLAMHFFITNYPCDIFKLFTTLATYITNIFNENLIVDPHFDSTVTNSDIEGPMKKNGVQK